MSIKYTENVKHKSMKIKIEEHLTLYMMLFQSSFAILCSTHDIL